MKTQTKPCFLSELGKTRVFKYLFFSPFGLSNIWGNNSQIQLRVTAGLRKFSSSLRVLCMCLISLSKECCHILTPTWHLSSHGESILRSLSPSPNWGAFPGIPGCSLTQSIFPRLIHPNQNKFSSRLTTNQGNHRDQYL